MNIACVGEHNALFISPDWEQTKPASGRLRAWYATIYCSTLYDYPFSRVWSLIVYCFSMEDLSKPGR